MWSSVLCTLIDNDTRHHSLVSPVSPQQILATVMTRIVLDRSTDHPKPHSICQFEYTQFKLEWKNHTLFDTRTAKIDIPISERNG